MESVAATAASRFRLTIFGDGSVRTIPLLANRWVIGRGDECEIPLRDQTVSRKHMLLERHGETFTFRDLGGRNPILLDGTPSSGGPVDIGQTIALGLTRLVLERREQKPRVTSQLETVIITGREVIDPGLQETDTRSTAGLARRILERIEWTFADLGALSDAAEPLLALGLNLTGYGSGLLGRFSSTGDLEALAMLDTVEPGRAVSLPGALLREAQSLRQASLIRTTGEDPGNDLLMIPLGDAPDGIMVFGTSTAASMRGQDLLRLATTLGKIVWHRLTEVSERLRLREEIQRLRFRGTIAHQAVVTSSRLRSVRELLRELANADTPILLVGEDGTEHEHLARYLHAERAGEAPLVILHAMNLAADRLEAALFGGSGSQAGALARALGGTLFVDGIARLPLPLQKRLAFALSNVRLVAAATADPAAAPEHWHPALAEVFANGVVTIPPLRTAAGDIVTLAELFLADMGAAPDGSPRLLSERAKRLLTAYPWPGNVRELRTVLEAAAAQAGNSQITPQHLPPEVASAVHSDTDAGVISLEELERRHIADTLKQLGGNRSRTAQALGIATSTLYDKLKRYGITS